MSEWMRLALVEAGRVVEQAYPYPGVGVVIVFENRAIAREHNGPPGSPHAEHIAIEKAVEAGYPLSQCALWTNLEPCCNKGGLAISCVDLILQHQIPEVHVAMTDPYHLVRGEGIAALEEAGVKVVIGEMWSESRWQNRRYLERFCCHCGWPIKD